MEVKLNGARIRALVLAAIVLIALVVLFFLLRPGSPAPESGDVEETQEEVVAMAINEGSMSPSEVTVDKGDQVNLLITSDRPVEFHIHGYDLTEEVEPGEPTELSFEATNTGRFAIENHNADAEIGVLLVQPHQGE
jgi:heme/copper-type cytochrome/quinol oxidase subunit 2